VVLTADETQSAAAIEAVDDFLRNEMSGEVRGSALGMRAELKQESGNLEGALEDLLAALPLTEDAFSRHVHEFCIAEVYRKRHDNSQVERWYRKSLETCAESGKFSGGAVLHKYLELQPQDRLPSQDLALCSTVALRSWKLLKLPGSPDLDDLSGTALKLIETESAAPIGR